MTPAIRDLSLDAVGGLEIGATPLATAISDYAFATQPSKTYDTFVVRKHARSMDWENESKARPRTEPAR